MTIGEVLETAWVVLVGISVAVLIFEINALIQRFDRAAALLSEINLKLGSKKNIEEKKTS